MMDHVLGRTYVLHPGDVALGFRGDVLQTLLGSCVSIILTDPRRSIGAMCHVVHAGDPLGGSQSPAFGGPAMAKMCALLRAQAIEPRLCEAWVMGGGEMFPSVRPGASVAFANAHWARQWLASADIRVLGEDLGGACYRKLSWTIGSAAPKVLQVPV